MRPFSRYIAFGEDRFHRAFRHAGIAIDTSLRINHQHVVVEMKGLDRAGDGTVGITTVNAGVSDDVGHAKNLQR
jgi:hypothetical protein